MTVEEVKWGEIYKKYHYQKAEKFGKVIKPPPLTKNFDDNVHIAAEWLYRNGKTAIDITRQEPYLNLVKDHWYEKNPEGTYFHVCYPVELMRFQHRYAHLFEEYLNISKKGKFNLKTALEILDRMKIAQWSAWKCTGWDGAMVWETDNEMGTNLTVSTISFEQQQKHVYHNKCSRCQQPMPRALQMFNKLQYGALKALKDA